MNLLLPALIVTSLWSSFAFGQAKGKKAQRRVFSSGPSMGLGFNLGYESTYGQAVTFHWLLNKSLDLGAGLGFNSTGLKLGAGPTFHFYLSRSFGLRFGTALVYSGGAGGEVALDGKFKDETTGKEEDISVSKTYQVSSALMLNSLFGAFFAIDKFTHLIGDVTYNASLTGNEVTFDEDLQLSRDVVANNKDNAEKKFEEKALEKAEAGGLGFTVGIRFLW